MNGEWFLTGERKREICGCCAKNLRVMRYYLNWKQKDLAEVAGTTHRRISEIETGKTKLSWTLYLALAAIFTANPEARQSPVYDVFVPEDVVRFLSDGKADAPLALSEGSRVEE